MSIFEQLVAIRNRRGAGFLPYLDPDRLDKKDLGRTASLCEAQGADAILIGGSFLLSTNFDRMVSEVVRAVDIPVIIFPGDTNQISAAADAIMFLSLISGRNPELLIGQHVKAAPILKAPRLRGHCNRLRARGYRAAHHSRICEQHTSLAARQTRDCNGARSCR